MGGTFSTSRKNVNTLNNRLNTISDNFIDPRVINQLFPTLSLSLTSFGISFIRNCCCCLFFANTTDMLRIIKKNQQKMLKRFLFVWCSRSTTWQTLENGLKNIYLFFQRARKHEFFNRQWEKYVCGIFFVGEQIKKLEKKHNLKLWHLKTLNLDFFVLNTFGHTLYVKNIYAIGINNFHRKHPLYLYEKRRFSSEGSSFLKLINDQTLLPWKKLISFLLLSCYYHNIRFCLFMQKNIFVVIFKILLWKFKYLSFVSAKIIFKFVFAYSRIFFVPENCC